MAALRFRASDTTLLTFARSDSYPRGPAQTDEGQVVSMSTTGLLRIATLRPPIVRMQLNFSSNNAAMFESDYQALVAFLNLPVVKLKALPFTLVDVDDSETLVRYDSGLYNFQQITPTLRQGTLVVRIEP